MDYYLTNITTDTEHLALSMGYEENLMAMRCAEKVLAHLTRQVEKGHSKYETNVGIVKQIIGIHKERMENITQALISKAS